MKEIICFHIGQAGVQIGESVWELLNAEHGISETGYLWEPILDVECLETFYSSVKNGRLIPRSLFVDLEPTCIDEIRKGSYRNLFHPDRLITGPEDAASNFARGFFTVGKLLLGKVSNELRKLLEAAPSTQAILIFRSLGGGTGSGLTSAIFDTLIEFPKLCKVELPIYPSPTLSSAMVEPYNCLLSEHFCMEDIDIGLLLDNEALYDICSKYLSMDNPTYISLNRLVGQLTSSITASLRFSSILNTDISVLQTNLVPYPRIHFPLANFAPLLSAGRESHEQVSVNDITRAVFERENQMLKIDHSFGRFMSCSLFYRGDVSPYHIYLALNEIKRDRNIEFVEWCPTGFKVGINMCPPTTIPASRISATDKNVTMLANTSAIGQAWQRLTHKFYLLYSKRSFVHWFVGEGMEECEFTESLYNISALVKDYEEVALDVDPEEGNTDISETGTKTSTKVPTTEQKINSQEGDPEKNESYNRKSQEISSKEKSGSQKYNSSMRKEEDETLQKEEEIRELENEDENITVEQDDEVPERREEVEEGNEIEEETQEENETAEKEEEIQEKNETDEKEDPTPEQEDDNPGNDDETAENEDETPKQEDESGKVDNEKEENVENEANEENDENEEKEEPEGADEKESDQTNSTEESNDSDTKEVNDSNVNGSKRIPKFRHCNQSNCRENLENLISEGFIEEKVSNYMSSEGYLEEKYTCDGTDDEDLEINNSVNELINLAQEENEYRMLSTELYPEDLSSAFFVYKSSGGLMDYVQNDDVDTNTQNTEPRKSYVSTKCLNLNRFLPTRPPNSESDSKMKLN